jgi:hypothetical protein
MFGQPVLAALTIVNDQAFIDNRASTDPLLTGLNLNLEVVVTDSVGGRAALLATGVATFSSSNPGYSLATTMFCCDTDPTQPTVAGFGATPAGVTPAQFPNITGTFTWSVSDANGSVLGTSHNLDLLEVLALPTNIAASNNTTTPTITWTDTNAAPPAGYIRGYDFKIYDAGFNQIYKGTAGTAASFAVPSGVLTAGQLYHLRTEILDAKISELNDPLHNPVESRSVGWSDFLPVPLPGGLVLLGSGLGGLIVFGRAGLRRNIRTAN